MANLSYDKNLEFGTYELSSGSGTFPVTLGLGETDAERMAVEFRVILPAAGGDSVAFQIKNKDAEGDSFETILTSRAYPSADLARGSLVRIPLPETKRILAVGLECAGTFTGGKLEARLNTYIGK